MARSYNRKYRRSTGMKKRLSVREEQEFKNLILIIFSIIVVCGLVYAFTCLILDKGILSKGYTKPTVVAPTIDYETSTIGTIFDKGDKEYYVIFDRFKEIHGRDVYLNSLLTMYADKDEKDRLPIYKVDMSYGVNDAYKAKSSNTKAASVEELKINGVTLIKIKNGKNILYLDDVDDIAKELGFSEVKDD